MSRGSGYGYLGALLVALGALAEQSTQEEVGDLDLAEDVGKLAYGAEHLAHEAVGAAHHRIELRAHTCTREHGASHVIALETSLFVSR